MIRQRLLLHSIRASTSIPKSRSSLLASRFSTSATHLASEAGEHKSGHISTGQNEGILFFNSLLPLNLQWFYRLGWSARKRSPILLERAATDSVGTCSPAEVLEDATAKDSSLGTVDVIEVLPRLKEAGAFVKFRHDSMTDSKAVADAVRKHLKEHPTRPWWNPLSSVKANLVLGKPWVEDLFRLPSPRLRVEFLPTNPGIEPAELSQEQLYSFFRPYGKLVDIIKQPSDSKVVPRYAFLDYARRRKAIMAKNCLHGYTVPQTQGGGSHGTILRITYERKERAGWIKEWIFGHPRIVIPLLAALIAGISIVIFDPIRTLSIRAHITRAFHLEDNSIFMWFRRQSEDLINKVKQLRHGVDPNEPGMQVLWDDRKSETDQIQSWLMETSDTFIVVQGPRGSGKREVVVDHALQHKRDAHKLLVVDCKPIQEARGDAATIAAAAAQVGYRPVFSWINNISGLIDLAAQGMTGVKAGFSETLEAQLTKIYNNTSSALKSIALEGRKKDDKDSNLSDDEYLEAHPEHRPVVVIDNFLHKNGEEGAMMVYDKLSEWAAQLTTSNIAHVIFLTNDIAFNKSLSKALPDRVFRQLTLGDCSPEVAKRYVVNHLDFDAEPAKKVKNEDDEEVMTLTPSQKRTDLNELDEVIPLLGGRLTDLEFLARRIKAGETPLKAVREIVDQSASEILKMFLISGAEDRQWSSQQAWTLVKSLAADETLRYNEVLIMDAFKSAGDKALTALEQAELISVQSLNGRPYSVKPGKPVYQPAFKRLVEDRVLAAKMDLTLLGDAIGDATKSIDKYEQELRLLGELPKQPGELLARVQWLLGKIASSQTKIEALEKESAALSKILTTEF